MGKKYYINDIANELSVSKKVICEFLKKSGININVGANSYISKKSYELIVKEFTKNIPRKNKNHINNRYYIKSDTESEILNIDEQKNIRTAIYGRNFRKSEFNSFDDFKSGELHLFYGPNNNVKEFRLFIYDGSYDISTKKDIDSFVLIETNNTIFIESIVKIKDIPIFDKYSTKPMTHKGYEFYIDNLCDYNEIINLFKDGEFIKLSEFDCYIIRRVILKRRKEKLELEIQQYFNNIPQKLQDIKKDIINVDIHKIFGTFTFWRIRKKFGTRKPGEGYDYWINEFYSIKSDLMYEVDDYFWDIIHMKNPQYNELVSKILDKYEKPKPSFELSQYEYEYPIEAQLEVRKSFLETYSKLDHFEHLSYNYYRIHLKGNFSDLKECNESLQNISVLSKLLNRIKYEILDEWPYKGSYKREYKYMKPYFGKYDIVDMKTILNADSSFVSKSRRVIRDLL